MYQIKNILHNKKGRPYTMARSGLRERMKAIKGSRQGAVRLEECRVRYSEWDKGARSILNYDEDYITQKISE